MTNTVADTTGAGARAPTFPQVRLDAEQVATALYAALDPLGHLPHTPTGALLARGLEQLVRQLWGEVGVQRALELYCEQEGLT